MKRTQLSECIVIGGGGYRPAVAYDFMNHVYKYSSSIDITVGATLSTLNELSSKLQLLTLVRLLVGEIHVNCNCLSCRNYSRTKCNVSKIVKKYFNFQQMAKLCRK